MEKSDIVKALSAQSIYELPLKVAYYAAPVPNDYSVAHGFDMQIKYCEVLISSMSHWKLVDSYVDGPCCLGSRQSRREFNRMVLDAIDNKYDMIITAEAIAFAEIPQDFARFARVLRDVGVGIFFPKLGTEYNTFSAPIEWLSSKLAEYTFWGDMDFDSDES